MSTPGALAPHLSAQSLQAGGVALGVPRWLAPAHLLSRLRLQPTATRRTGAPLFGSATRLPLGCLVANFSASSGSAIGGAGGGVMASSASAAATAESGSNGAGSSLPEIVTEFMVEMSCQGCVKNVRRNLEPVEGVKEINISLEDKVVRVTGTSTLLQLEEGLKKTGLRSRLIGQGDPEKLELTAAVAEFKGPSIFGVVRFTQVNMDVARVEAELDGLKPYSKHGWSVNEFGDLTNGAASTGGHFNPAGQAHGDPASQECHAGDLGNLETDEKGHAVYSAANDKLKVWDLIGRSVVVYEGPDDLGKGATEASRVSGDAGRGIAAAVIARSAGVGQNYKSICTCDGTIIWEATNSDFVQQKL